jgi:hypothetical protein
VHLSIQPDRAGVGEPRAKLIEFRLELGLPVWGFEHQGHVIEKRIIMPHRQNTVLITFERLSGNGTLQLLMIPWIQFRPHEGALSSVTDSRYALRLSAGRYEIEDTLDASLPPLRIQLVGESAKFAFGERRLRNARYPIEQSRGYDASGDLYSPGQFSAAVEAGVPAAPVASVEDWRTINTLSPAQALSSERMRRERLVEIAHPSVQTKIGSQLVMRSAQSWRDIIGSRTGDATP